MDVPRLMSIPMATDRSGLTEEDLLNLGLVGTLRFYVVIAERGACLVPEVALSHIMAGEESYSVWRTTGHSPATLRGAIDFLVKRDHLRILVEDWNRFEIASRQLLDASDKSQEPPETVEERGNRLLSWHDEEVTKRGERGAVARVTAREKVLRPTAHRPNVGKEIRAARERQSAARRAGPFDALVSRPIPK
jgi:hypothetical protein